MIRVAPFAILVFAATVPFAAHSEPQCLPKSLFPPDYELSAPKFDLGLVAGVPTLCAPTMEMSEDRPLTPINPDYLQCWSVDPTTGALAASTATSLPGHSRHGKTDAKGCIEGYCPPGASADEMLLWTISTNGQTAVVLRDRKLFVFDASSKKQQTEIPLYDENGPENANVGNEPIEILYLENGLYVVGADAGPYTAVWAYKDDGTRTGAIRRSDQPADETGGSSVYNGAVNIIDGSHIVFASPGLKSMIILDAATGKREELKRDVETSACTAEEMQNVEIGDYEIREAEGYSGVSKACHDMVVAELEPYFDLDPVRLPSGDFLAALAGKNRGELAILDGTTLKAKTRLKMPRCTN